MRLYLFYALIISCLAACHSGGDTNQRPHDPWVFRSVLDWKPRVITLALHKDMWVAYSTENAALYKAWKGSVYFDGPVYTHAHGPQPISIGDAYQINNYEKPWFWTSDKNDSIPAIVAYKGHRFVNDHVQLMYGLSDSAGVNEVLIYEQVEAMPSSHNKMKLERQFEIKRIKGHAHPAFHFNVTSVVETRDIDTDATLDVKKSAGRNANTSNPTMDIDGIVTLKKNKHHVSVYFSAPSLPNENTPGDDNEAEEDKGLPPGAKLIAKSDCKTCHNPEVKTVGPSYKEIAVKYETNPSNIRSLVQKIKNGGSGVWGNVAMTAHADLPEADITQMVEYILSLDESTSKEVAETAKVFSFKDVAIRDTNALLPGAVTRIFDVPVNTAAIPSLPANKKPKQAGIKNNFDNIDGAEFADLTDNFSLYAEGYLKADIEGEYTFEIWSDDGSKLYLHNELVITNDGPHGTEGKFGKVTLTKGYHPFRLEYFQGGGGKYLSLNWIKPGDKAAEVIPAKAILHDGKNQMDFTGLSLPMANASQIPGNKSALTGVHPAFNLTQARPDNFEPKVGGMDFKKDGRMVISTWDAAGSVWMLENVHQDDPSKIKVKKIAFGLAEPLGLKIVDDTIFVMQKQEMTKLVDTNGDDIIDEYHTLCDDWGVSANFHEFGFGLEYKDGFFYATLATAIQPGGASTNPQIKDRGKVIRVERKTGKIEYLASGLRTPNGIGIGYNGEIFVADNQGDWLPSSKIVHVLPGAWYGSRSVDFEGTAKLKEKWPVVWLPQDEIGNSPSTPSYIDVGPYKGQMIHGEVTHGGVKRVFVEEVKEQLQGCVFRFIQGLEAGVNRLKWGPDGALYVGGIGNPGNWSHAGKKWFGLQRLAYNGTSVFEMLAVRAKANGMELEFTEPLAEGEGNNPSLYEVRQWYYKPTIDYGGPKLGEKKLTVKSVTLSKDRKKAFLELDGLTAGHVVYVNITDGMISSKGNSLWSTEAWYTLNELPETKGVVAPSKESFAPNTLTSTEIAQGWKLLFDGKKIDQWLNFNKTTLGKGWIIQDQAIHLNAIKEDGKWQAKDGGDLVSKESYQDFEFKLEWKIANCGNSGIMFNVVQDPKYDYVWQTGPEMQILDNTCHPDTRFITHRAGDLYDMLESAFPCAKPAGQWNKVMIRSKGGKVAFYLNGYKTVSFDINAPEWQKMIKGSKFKDMPGFGQAKSGQISLQDHGDKVWFRNLKIRKI